MFVDTHAHLDDKRLVGDLDAVLDRARQAGVERVITAGTDLRSSAACTELAEKHEMVTASVGVHPHDADEFDENTMRELSRMAENDAVVAIGETGLDYFRSLSPRDSQQAAFNRHLDLALEVDLPVIVHCRDAWHDCVDMLERRAGSGLRGVAHCFSGDAEIGARLRRLGFFISFAGNVTYPNAGALREAAARISAEASLVETDCPYLAPQPCRGKRNEPSFVVHTAEQMAGVYGLTLDDIARVTTFNAFQLFGVGDATDPGAIVYPIGDGLYVNLTNRCTNRCSFCPRETHPFVKGHSLALEKEPEAGRVIAAIGDPGQYSEIVFCGFGEPMLRLDVLRTVAAWVKKVSPGTPVRINTNGHGAMVHGRPICAELKGLVDSVSVSLNAGDRDTYTRLCRPERGAAAYDAMLAFIRQARETLPEIVLTAIDMPGVDLAACRRLAAELGVKLRVRKYDDVGTPK